MIALDDRLASRKNLHADCVDFSPESHFFLTGLYFSCIGMPAANTAAAAPIAGSGLFTELQAVPGFYLFHKYFMSERSLDASTAVCGPAPRSICGSPANPIVAAQRPSGK